jgi:hypothetical protein
VSVLGSPLQLNIIFVVKASRIPKSGTAERCFTQVGSDLMNKHKTRLDRLARDKYSNFL